VARSDRAYKDRLVRSGSVRANRFDHSVNDWLGVTATTYRSRSNHHGLSLLGAAVDGYNYVRAGIYGHRHGLVAYYHRLRHAYDFDDFDDVGYVGVSYYGAFHAGSFYPYGYVSPFDAYYYRYPYSYSYPVSYQPIWTTYREPATSVYVEAPQQVVYVDSNGGPADSASAPPDINYYGASTAPAEAPETIEDAESDTVQVGPQERIPVNNAYLADGAKSFQTGDYEQAVSEFARALLNDPENGFAQLGYAVGQFAIGDFQAAAQAVRRGLALVPDVVDQPIDVSRQYGVEGDFERHLQSLQRYVSANPQDQDGWFLLGYLAYAGGKPADAIRALEKAAAINPQDTYAAVLRDAVKRVTPRS